MKSHDFRYNAEALDIVVKNASCFRENIGAVGVGVYGSIATGASTKYSDLDLLVIVNEEQDHKEVKRRSIEYWRTMLPIDVDVCAVRMSDFEKLPIGIKSTLKMLEVKKP